MNDKQKQVVLGTLLGNGYICQGSKNSYLCMRHSIKHLSWLQTKSSELTKYGAATPFYISGTTCTWRSVSHPIFTDLRKFCYPDGTKQVSMEWLNTLTHYAIAIWYGDSGTLMGRKQKNACLRTQSYGLEGNKIIEQFFNEVDIPCHLNKSRNSYVVVFTVPGTDRLIRMLAEYLPPNRYPKLLAGQFQT
jgi:hypothetical protein